MRKIVSDLEKQAIYQAYEESKEMFGDVSVKNRHSNIFLLLDEHFKNCETIEELEKSEMPKKYKEKLQIIEEMWNEK